MGRTKSIHWIPNITISVALLHRVARHAKHMRQKIPSPWPVPTSLKGKRLSQKTILCWAICTIFISPH